MIKEELGTWYPIVDEGEYWTDYDLNESYNVPKIKTVVTNGQVLWTHNTCPLGWGTMAKLGDWKYMRVKID